MKCPRGHTFFNELTRIRMADQQKDLVLPPNMFAFVLDNTKGNVSILNGPHKEPLSETDIPVIFDNETKKFVPTRILSDAQRWASLERCPAKGHCSA